MAAPTDLRVEAVSITSVILRWVYPGASTIAVYRSIDGVIYTEVTTIDTRVAVGTLSYTDIDLDTGTKYWYKVSDDGGSTFSAVVTVFSQACGLPPAGDLEAVLPRSDGQEVTPLVFDDLAMRVETGLVRFTNPDGRTCTACIVDGALVIDCVNFTNCEIVEVEVTEDVNSISMPNCENDLKQIDFLIPPGTTRGICGWPGGSGFGGDECFRAPVAGGTAGRRISVPMRQGASTNSTLPKSRPGYARGSGGGGSGAACTCVPNGNAELTIKSCNPNNSLNCSTTKSLELKACGGLGPYTWSKTGTVTIKVGSNGIPGSIASGSSVIINPPTNTGSGVAGVAYTQVKQGCRCSGSGACAAVCSPLNYVGWTDYGCDDVRITDGQADYVGDPSGCGAAFGTCVSGECGTCPTCRCSGGTCNGQNAFATSITFAAAVLPVSGGATCDKRTAPMIAAGCAPCGVAATTSTVSVTDSLGTVATIILKA